MMTIKEDILSKSGLLMEGEDMKGKMAYKDFKEKFQNFNPNFKEKFFISILKPFLKLAKKDTKFNVVAIKKAKEFFPEMTDEEAKEFYKTAFDIEI